MLGASQSFGEKVGQVLRGGYGLDFKLLAVQIVHEEELGVDVLATITFDVTFLDLGYTRCVVFIDRDRW